MAFQCSQMTYVSAFLLVAFTSGLAVKAQSFQANMECRNLSAASCAFAVDTFGERCVLETFTGEDGTTQYECQTSDILAYKLEAYVETEHCVKACGVDRTTLGISTDAFVLPGFTEKLCSIECQKDCSNIVDLFARVVASVAEGASLDRVCTGFHASRGIRRELRAGHFSLTELSSFVSISPSSFIGAEGPSFSVGPGAAEGPSSVHSVEGPAPSSG